LAVRQPTVPVNIIEYCQSGKFFEPLEGNEHVVLKTNNCIINDTWLSPIYWTVSIQPSKV